MDKKFAEGQVTLTTGNGTWSAGFVERAIAFALKHGLTDEHNESKSNDFSMAVHTIVGPIVSRTITDTSYPGFWVDWEVDGEYIALSTSEYQADEGVFVTHEYADLSEDSPTVSKTHYFAEQSVTDAKTVLERLRKTEETT